MESTTTDDLENHPELAPILEIDSRGAVACLGWVSPVYTFDREFLGEEVSGDE